MNNIVLHFLVCFLLVSQLFVACQRKSAGSAYGQTQYPCPDFSQTRKKDKKKTVFIGNIPVKPAQDSVYQPKFR